MESDDEDQGKSRENVHIFTHRNWTISARQPVAGTGIMSRMALSFPYTPVPFAMCSCIVLTADVYSERITFCHELICILSKDKLKP